MCNSYRQRHAGATGFEFRFFTSKHHMGQEDPSKRKEKKTLFSQPIGNFENAKNWQTMCARWCNNYNLDNNQYMPEYMPGCMPEDLPEDTGDRVFFYCSALRMTLRKFWHLELFECDLLCNLTFFGGGTVKTRPKWAR